MAIGSIEEELSYLKDEGMWDKSETIACGREFGFLLLLAQSTAVPPDGSPDSLLPLPTRNTGDTGWKTVQNLIDFRVIPVEKEQVREATFGIGQGSCLERA